MSYQPYPPAGGDPVVQQPAAPFAAGPQPDQRGGRKPALIGVGALLLAAGLVAGIVLIMAASSNEEQGVENLARAPIGCTTTLQFDESGTYYVYLETTGSIGELRGDCPNADQDYDLGGDDVPDVDIVLLDERGDEIDLDRDESKEYDAAGFVGRSAYTVDIDEPGDFELTATSDDDNSDEVVVAVGRTPADDAASLRTTGIAALVAGVVLGGLLLVLGLRRAKPSSAAPLPPGSMPGMPGGYPPSGQFPVTPPAAPPAPSPPAPSPPAPSPPAPSPPATPPTMPMPAQPTMPMPARPTQPPAPPTAPPTSPAPPAPPAPPSPPPGGWPAPPTR